MLKPMYWVHLSIAELQEALGRAGISVEIDLMDNPDGSQSEFLELHIPDKDKTTHIVDFPMIRGDIEVDGS